MQKYYIIIFIVLIHIYTSSCAQNKIISFRIDSPFQADSTNLRVLLPDNFDQNKVYKILYILPVRPTDTRPFGDGLMQIKRYNYQNKYDLICVAPEFTSIPWYANHETNQQKQDERHLLETVIPFIDSHYTTLKKAEGRYLLGFSKSGVGAFSLLLRHPNLFNKAAGWDIGIQMDMGPISESKREERINEVYGTESNFENYRISNLLEQNGAQLGDSARLFLYNTESVRGPGGVKIHELIVKLKIPHRYLFEPYREHRWDSGWIPETIRFLMDDPIKE